jgi:hypothetical protein
VNAGFFRVPINPLTASARYGGDPDEATTEAIYRTVFVCAECRRECRTGHEPGCSLADGDETIDVTATPVKPKELPG